MDIARPLQGRCFENGPPLVWQVVQPGLTVANGITAAGRTGAAWTGGAVVIGGLSNAV
jgi:hypothetical protein